MLGPEDRTYLFHTLNRLWALKVLKDMGYDVSDMDFTYQMENGGYFEDDFLERCLKRITGFEFDQDFDDEEREGFYANDYMFGLRVHSSNLQLNEKDLNEWNLHLDGFYGKVFTRGLYTYFLMECLPDEQLFLESFAKLYEEKKKQAIVPNVA